MQDYLGHSPLMLCLIVVIFGAAASLLPFSPVEPVLVAIAAVAPHWLLLPLVALATVSHMSTKTLIFAGGAKARDSLRGRSRVRFDRISVRLSGRSGAQRTALFVSAATGLPPFYLTTALCGSLRMPLREFLVFATAGRAIRFAALIFLPQLLGISTAAAQQPAPPAVTMAGRGPDTYVLVSGLVGGVAGFARVERRLVQAGSRVVVIDPYQLSLDSADVSFDALARRTEAELAARGIVDAHIVGHAHGGGVAIRLVSRSPSRARDLTLLDVGAQPVNRSPVFGASLRLIPFLTRMPFGRSFVRDRFIDGLIENSVRTDWLDERARCAYVDRVLDNITVVIAMARRLATAEEPEAVGDVIARLTLPVTVLRGEFRGPGGPTPEEMAALAPLGRRLRILTVAGVGHFPHEEAPAEVVRLLLRSTAIAAGSGGPR
jgi:pimeloyl-ACP methyl ester carboxylesterase/membrane protein YqaA with SNARE-associated domain